MAAQLVSTISTSLVQFILIGVGLFMAYMLLSALSGLIGGRR